ncbi:hypothetical protein [Roseimarinus sediminis]|uniref:hypothetical protein n=1 Tax=Roseimarinus sediminis TaxID=1610899 RepID=UPI003D1E93A7
MKSNSQAYDDLNAIRQMMERSSKFLSLSGLSGIFAGISALVGAAYVYFVLLQNTGLSYSEYIYSLNQSDAGQSKLQLIAVAFITLMLALAGAFLFSLRKARKNNVKYSSKSTRQLLIHLLISLISGGIFCLLLLWHNNAQLLAPASLLFYGLALVNAGKFTFGEIHYLGISQIILGLAAGLLIHQALLLWILGFGVLHIVYGMIMYFKYDR